MIGLPDEAPVPLQPDRGKRISPFNDLEGQFQQPVSTSKDMSGNLKVHDTTHLETQTWEPTPLPLLERNALMAHPDSQPYYLTLIQPPQEGRVNAGRSKGKPLACSLHPEPILELQTQDDDPYNYHRTSPHFMCIVELVADDEIRSPVQDGLGGSLVSSLHNLRMKDDKDHAYFIFGDLCPRFVGSFCLKFVLFELRCDGAISSSTYAKLLTSTMSQPFIVKEAKGVGISKASTPLTRMVAECGVKIRVRKEPTNKRKQSQTSWAVRGPSEPNDLRVQAPVLKDVLGFDPTQLQFPNHANSLGAHSQYPSRHAQNPFPSHMGQITPPTRGVEEIWGRVSVQIPISAQEGPSAKENLSIDGGHLKRKVALNQESHPNHLNHVNVGHLRQYGPNLPVMAGYGAQAVPFNNDSAYQAPGGSFIFSGASNNFAGLTAETNTGSSAQLFNMSSRRNTQLSNMEPGFSPPMSTSVSTTNSRIGNMVSPARSRIGKDDVSSAGFASRSQFSSMSSGLAEWDHMDTSSSSYTPIYSASMSSNTQNTANMPHSANMTCTTSNTANMSHTGSTPYATPYSTNMSQTPQYSTSMPSISQYVPRMPDATPQVTQYSSGMTQMPFYNPQYPSSSSSQSTQKFAGYEWQFGSGYGASPSMVSHG